MYLKTYLYLTLSLMLSVNAFAKPSKTIRVACVGNSITYGMTIDKPEVNSYPAQLQKLLGQKYEVGNFGKSGATLLRKGHRPYNEQEEYKRAVAYKADIIVIHLGINDTDPRNWPHYQEEFFGDYLQLIDSLRSGNPKARLLISRLSPIHAEHPRFESGTRDWHEQIQHEIERIAKHSGAQLIDLHEALYPYPHMLPDAIHPTREGATRLAQTVYSAITGDYGGLQLPIIYTDNMVLQRERPIILRGKANAGEIVRITLGKYRTEVATNSNGKWEATLPAQSASAKGQTLKFSTPTRTIEYKDVLLGDVWLASGQSNMAWTMNQTDGAERAQQANDTLLRLFDMKEHWHTDNSSWSTSALDSVNALHYYRPTQWQHARPESVAAFSSVAYTFAQRLRDSLNVPIGIICNAIGGSTTESWIDRRTLEWHMPAVLRKPKTNDFAMPWVRQRMSENLALRAQDATQRHPYDPTYLFDAGIQPLAEYPIKGVIWYQGESNAHNIEAHERLFTLLADSWRKHWDTPNLPIYMVQLSSLNRPSWPRFRDSQRRLADALPHVYMVVSSDLGDPTNVHPRQKEPIGHRLALQALRHSYGRTITSEGPRVVRVHYSETHIALEMSTDSPLTTSDGTPLRGFEIADKFGPFVEAQARIQGNTIHVSHPQAKQPQRIRYAWTPYTDANLYNKAGLPASTFSEEKRP